MSECKCVVQLDELAAAAGIHPHGIRSMVPSDDLRHDWAGRQGVSVEFAEVFVREHRTARAMEELRLEGRKHAYDAYSREHDGRRAEVTGKAFLVARDAAARRAGPVFSAMGPQGGYGHVLQSAAERKDVLSQAKDAARFAGIEFDERNPKLSIEAWLRTREGKEYA